MEKGYVKKLRTKPNTCAGKERLFLVKANVSASMKQQRYLVYSHLDQASAEVKFLKCNCKAGQGGCCKHVAAVLYMLLDYLNLRLKEVPDDVKCTQVLQKWSIPSSQSGETTKAVKFEDLIFEYAEYLRDAQNKRKRPMVTGRRQNYCTTPPFAKKVQKEEIGQLYSSLQAPGKCSLLCGTFIENNFKPSSMFETSSTPKHQEVPIFQL